MGLAATAASVVQVISPRKTSVVVIGGGDNSSRNNSMSHQGIFSFSASEQEQQHHVAQQSRRDKLRMQGFEPAAASHHTHPLLVGGGIEEDDVDDEGGDGGGGGGGGGGGIYEAPAVATNMLSEMFNFPAAAPAGPTATELLASQIHGAGYRLPSSRQVPGSMVGFSNDWYCGDGGGSTSNDLSTIGDPKQLNPESAAAMQLFLMNPQQQQHEPRSPPHHQHQHQHHLFQDSRHGSAPFVTHEASSFSGGHQLVDSQGLSLSLSSSLHQFEMAKAEQNVLYFNQQPPQQLHTQGGYGTAAPAVGVNLQLRNSRYARAAQELLEEFCSVGRGQHLRGPRRGKHHGARSSTSNPNPSGAAAAAGGASTSAASSKDIPPLSPAERFEHQRNKSKLLTMLDEVDRRYNHYCEQMQMVVTSFDSVMGYGAATPYTALAQKAMSRHFRCLKDAIGEQLKRACEALGEKDTGAGSGITKGETPRLRLLDQSLRQQRAFHQMGMIEQEAWRPQRGLPERSVTVLRAWLFEHFLHPYPSDADKHLLARQTGLSRNQVSNWFINARVRLWKPMVEEMYQQESKDDTDHDTVQTADDHSPAHHHSQQQVQQQRPETEAEAAAAAAGDSDHTSMHQRFPNIDHVIDANNILPSPAPAVNVVDPAAAAELCAAGLGPAARMRLGTAGDVSLTLGLRHAGTGGGGQDIINRFTVRDHFGG